MELATVREAVNLTNNTKAISPYTLRQVLTMYATKEEAASGGGGGSGGDLSLYAKKSDLPTKVSQLTNDLNFVPSINGTIPIQYLPSHVTDVFEFSSTASFPIPGDPGKLYIDTSSDLIYRWDGSDYVTIASPVMLGITSDTAFRGDHGKIAYDHAMSTGNAHGMGLSDLGIIVDTTTINYLLGLDKNILLKLNEYLPLAGGVMTGHITLVGDPVAKMHPATKNYVDTNINAISVRVTQNVTRLEEVTDNLEEQSRTIAVQAETITEVQNDLTGIDQKTISNLEAISTLSQNVAGLSSTVSQTEERVTELTATVNKLEISLMQDTIVVPVDNDNKPLEDASYTIEYTSSFGANQIEVDKVRIEGEHTGIGITADKQKITLTLNKDTAIPNSANTVSLYFEYTQTLLYTVGKLLVIVTVPPGPQGAPGPAGIGGATQSYEPPEDTENLWLDLNTNELKRYIIENGEGLWIVVNDFNSDFSNLNEAINNLNKELQEKTEELQNSLTTLETLTSTQFNQTSSQFEMIFNQEETLKQEVNSRIEEHERKQEQYIRFEEGKINLGEADSPYSLVIDNDKITIYYNETKISEWDKDEFTANQVGIKRPEWNHKFIWLPRVNGSISFRKVSDE